MENTLAISVACPPESAKTPRLLPDFNGGPNLTNNFAVSNNSSMLSILMALHCLSISSQIFGFADLDVECDATALSASSVSPTFQINVGFVDETFFSCLKNS